MVVCNTVEVCIARLCSNERIELFGHCSMSFPNLKALLLGRCRPSPCLFLKESDDKTEQDILPRKPIAWIDPRAPLPKIARAQQWQQEKGRGLQAHRVSLCGAFSSGLAKCKKCPCALPPCCLGPDDELASTRRLTLGPHGVATSQSCAQVPWWSNIGDERQIRPPIRRQKVCTKRSLRPECTTWMYETAFLTLSTVGIDQDRGRARRTRGHWRSP